jgi:hypothetical protein
MMRPLSGTRYLVLTAALALFAASVYLIAGGSTAANERKVIPYLPTAFAQPDNITRAIRSPGRAIYRVRELSGPLRRHAVTVGRVGQEVLVSVDSANEKRAVQADARRLSTEISLPGRRFDPVEKAPEGTVSPGLNAAPSGDGYYIVQFGTTATDELLDSLKATGVEVLQYVPHQAFFVYGNGESIAKAATHSRVRWVGEFRAEYKLSTVLAEQIDAYKERRPARDGISGFDAGSKRGAAFDIAVFKRADLDEVATRITALGGSILNKIDLPDNYFNVIRAQFRVDAVEAAAQIPDVIRIDAWNRPSKEDERAAQIVAGNFTSQTVISGPGYDPLTQFGVNGQNVTVAVVDDGVGIPGDGGFYITSNNAIDGPMRGAASGADGHGHLNASIIAGDAPFSVLDPLNYNYGLGIAPKSNILNIPLLVFPYAGTEADTANDTVVNSGPNGVKGSISNNSWGNGLNGNAYDSYTAQFDGFARDASASVSIDPLLFVFSAGNQSVSGLTRPHVAKNVIATASMENLRSNLDSTADNMDDLSGFSSLGPAADGRIKPDIAAPGTAITGGRSGPSPLFGNIGSFHRWSSGTSHAAPQIAGAAALFTQFWKNGHAGSIPSPALVKAALINSARDTNGLNTGASVPNGNEGWGRVYLKGMLSTGAAITYVNQSQSLFGTGAVRTYSGSVADAGRPVRVTLVWTDPPAVGDPSLVNDLDLEVTVGGNTFKGNVLSGGLSITGGASDDVNNVENVFLPAGITGPLSISVTGSAINGNGVLGNADATDQHFALVVYNASVSAVSSASLSMESPIMLTGNALVEPNECNQIYLPLSNSGSSAATGVIAALTTTTPGVSIQPVTNPYPDVPANGGIVNSLAPFQISTTNSVACFTQIDLTLTVNYSGGSSPAVFNFTLPVGTPADPNYSFNASSGTISTTGTIVPGSNADDALVSFAVPFGFSIYGTNVAAGSTIRISTNGFVRVDSSGTGTSPNNASLPAAGTDLPANIPVLMPYWDDLDMRPSILNSGGIFTEVTGSPGSQTLKIEWRARHFISGQTMGPRDTNFAVYFHEGSNQFEYIYVQTGAGAFAGGDSATVGVQAATTGSIFTEFSFDSSSLSPGLKLNATQTPAACTSGTGACFATAAGVGVSGRVTDRRGRGIAGIAVTLSSATAATRTMTTNSFGYYRFDEVPAGGTYILSAASRRYAFQPLVVEPRDELDGVDLVAEN